MEVRVIAATNKNPEDAIRDKLLREDLYYRLNVFHIMLPPLRDRKDDIPAISEAILVNLNKKHGCRVTGLHPSTLERFQAHSWPGNIRELRNILERAVIMASEGLILPKHVAMDSNATFDPHPSAAPPVQDQNAASERSPANEQSPVNEQNEPMEALRIRPGASMEEIEETYINLILQRTNNNKTRAAEILGISVRTLHNRLGQLGKISGDRMRATGAIAIRQQAG